MSEPTDAEQGTSWEHGHGLTASGGPRALTGSEIVGAGHYGLPAASGEADGAAPWAVLAMLLRSKRLILAIFLALSAVAVPLIWLMVKPTYQAVASIRIAPEIPRLVFDTEENGIHRFFGLYMNTQIANITSPIVLQRALERPEVAVTEWFQHPPRTLRSWLGAAPPHPLDRLEAALTAEPEPQTELITVKMKSVTRDPDVIVNAVVDEYIRRSKEETEELETQRFETLRKQRQMLEEQIDGLVDSMGNLSKQLGTDDPDIVRSQLATQLQELELQRQSLNRAWQLTRWALETRKSDDAAAFAATRPAEPPEGGRQYSADAEWTRLNASVENLQRELGVARRTYGEAHPQIRELQSNLNHAQRLLAQRETELGPAWHGGAGTAAAVGDQAILLMPATQLSWMADKQKRELELLDDQIRGLKEEQERKGELAKQVAQFADQLKRTRALHEAVHNRLQTLEMEQKAPGRISLAAAAVAPSEPFRDRRVVLTLVALAAALLTGTAAAQIRSRMNPTICAADEVQQAVHVPFLGQIPLVTSAGLLSGDGDVQIAECVRIIRTALLERVRGTDKRVVLITSSAAQSGKSTVAALLARSLAHLGKKTLLVEADLRRPTLAARLGLDTRCGLSALLTDAATDRQTVLHTDVPKLDVVVAGPPPAEFNPELLANGHFAACLARWRKAYDFVLLDSPPVLPVADARILAGHADGTIMVLRAAHSRRGDEIQAFADLSAAGGRLLGTVLVGARPTGGYGYGYGYAASQDAAAAALRAPSSAERNG
jgi:polysaccharide biosynthesis transport protein